MRRTTRLTVAGLLGLALLTPTTSATATGDGDDQVATGRLSGPNTDAVELGNGNDRPTLTSWWNGPGALLDSGEGIDTVVTDVTVGSQWLDYTGTQDDDSLTGRLRPGSFGAPFLGADSLGWR